MGRMISPDPGLMFTSSARGLVVRDATEQAGNREPLRSRERRLLRDPREDRSTGSCGPTPRSGDRAASSGSRARPSGTCVRTTRPPRLEILEQLCRADAHVDGLGRAPQTAGERDRRPADADRQANHVVRRSIPVVDAQLRAHVRACTHCAQPWSRVRAHAAGPGSVRSRWSRRCRAAGAPGQAGVPQSRCR